jgi:hypothetical protein
MTKLCLRCGDHPVATEDPPSFPFCETCWPEVAVEDALTGISVTATDRFSMRCRRIIS